MLASPICINAEVGAAPGDLPKWLYAVASSLSIDPSDPSVPPYTDILTAQGQDQHIGDPWVLVGFGQTMTLAKFMNALGDDVTSDGIVEQMKSFEGLADPRLAGAPVRQVPEAPGVCTTTRSSTSTTARTSGSRPDFVPPPEGWTVGRRHPPEPPDRRTRRLEAGHTMKDVLLFVLLGIGRAR